MSETIEAKDAVRVALAAIKELYTDGQVPGLTLEEVELVEDGAVWNVTLGFTRSGHKSAIEAMTGQAGEPGYKVLRIDARTGIVRSMKNRLI